MNLNRIKKVVVVYDEKNSGKTDSLCRLCDLLITRSAKGYILRMGGSQKKLNALPKRKNGKYKDVLFATVVQKQNGDEATIGVGTAGDNWDAVWRNFLFFDSVMPERQFDVVFIAVREQDRRDGLFKSKFSFPLLAVEELECHYGLNCVQRPFERTTGVPKGYGGSQIAFQHQCQFVNQQLASKLMGMI